jgi:general secretion pathway protein A
MYAEYFGLKQAPFSIAPDPHYLFMSERHREALAHLLYGLGGGGGFVLLTGEIGAGKTTVCRCFLEQIPKRCNVAYIFNPKLTVVELMRSVCDEFLVPYPNRRPGTATVTDYLDPLNAFLLRTHGVGQNNVLIIDEAQNLSPDVLEQLRLMTNLETHERKLLQIILIGQPELRDMVAQPGLQQLAQRVIARFHLEALSEDETAQYIRHRLAVAGMTGPIPFPVDSLKRIHRLCRGVPRRINLLCDRALLAAYARGRTGVDAAMVDAAAREVFDDRRPPQTGRRVAAAVGVAAVLVGAAWWFTQHPQEAGDPARAAALAASAAAASAPPGTSVAVAQRLSDGPASAPGAAWPVLDSAGLAARAGWPDEPAAWRALAAAWRVSPAAGDACTALAASGLACFRGPATLPLIRQLDRPGWLWMRSDNGPDVPALLTGLGERQAFLRLPDGVVAVSFTTLASRWTGEFATLYRPPPADDATAWIEARLIAEQTGTLPADTPLRARIEAFQRAQGLRVDGLVGPLTVMQLNRVAAVAEPRLNPER